MKKIHNKHDEGEAAIMSKYIQDACVDYMKILCQQSKVLHDQYDEKTLISDEHQDIAQQFITLRAPYDLTDDLATKIKDLWSDPGIKETLNKRHHYQIHDNVAYFFDRIDVISQIDYEPNFEDFLRIRS